ncbi:MAG: hypothetical protein ACI4EA_04515, partial [Candidatus Ornithomonoglobus sp.]
FGGQLLGTPDTISSDGVSYWNDTSKLDSVFNDVAAKQGWTADSSVDNAAYNQTMQSVKDMNSKSGTLTGQFGDEALKQYKALGDNTQAQFDYANQDITNTDEYKSTWDSIMPAYEYASDKAALNAAADSAASNVGNIDSFAAANARRQREASLATGQQIAAEQARQAYLDRISGMNTTNETNRNNVLAGAQAAQGFAEAADVAAAREQSVGQSYYENWQDMLDRAAGRKATEANASLTNAQARQTDAQARQIDAETTGYAPIASTIQYNPYYDKDGNVNLDRDYMQIINNYDALLQAELAKEESKQDKERIQQYQNGIAQAEQARIDKQNITGEYIDDGYVNKYYKPTEYAPNVEARYAIDANNQSAYDLQTLSGNQNLAEIAATTESQMALNSQAAALSGSSGSTSGGSSKSGGSSGSSSSGSSSSSSKSAISNSNIDKYIEYLNEGMKKTYGDSFAGLSVKKMSGSWTTSNDLAKQYMIRTVYSDTSLTDNQANTILHAAGISADDIEQYSANSLTDKWNNGYASANGK